MTGPAVTTPDISAQVSSIVEKIMGQANWRSEMEKTVRRNLKLVEKNRELEAANKALTDAAPKEGERVLKKDEVVQFDAFKALNLKPEELKVVVEEHGKFKVKVQEQEAEKDYAEAAKALEFENVPAFTRWLAREKLHLEFQEESYRDEEGTKKVRKVPMVRPKDNDKAKLEGLDVYMEREVPEFVDTFKNPPVSEEGGSADGDGDELEGDDFIGRAALEAERRVGGVRIPATRSSSTSTPAGRARRTQAQLEQEAADNPMYSA